jgi:hypothetical protein
MAAIPSPMNELAGGIASLATSVATIENNYLDSDNEQASLGAGMLQAEDDVDALQAAVALIETNYTGGANEQANVGAACLALEARIHTMTKAFTYEDVAAIGGGASGSIDFASNLPVGAIPVGCGVNVTAVFDNINDTASMTIAVGVKSGDTDGYMVAAAADTVCKIGTPGVLLGGLNVGTVTPSILVDPDVACNTITKGSATAYLTYILAY